MARNVKGAINAQAARAATQPVQTGGGVVTPLEALALGYEQPMQEYGLRRRAMLDQWDTWAASGGEDAGGFWRGLLGGFFG